MSSAHAHAAALAAAAILVLAGAPAARASNPGSWLLTGASSVPNSYWQGLASDPAEADVYFTGVLEGLWRTTPRLRQSAGVPNAIPPAVELTEGYNHIGDPTWNPGGGGRVLLPLECYSFSGANTCGTGSFGVADPETLSFRYYVKLDPAQIPKAMWAETSPNGSRVWTSSGDNLLAYRSSEVSAANAAPGGPALRSVRRLAGAVPPTGVTGAVFWHGRLLLAGERSGTYEVWAVDLSNGERRLELKMSICGESEGLDVIRTLGGKLHWLIAAYDPGCELTFGPSSALLHFVPRRGDNRLVVDVRRLEASEVPGKVVALVRVTSHSRPLSGARVSFAGAKAWTNRHGRANVSATLQLPGRFRALARKEGHYGLSDLVPVGVTSTAQRAPVPRSGAR